MSVETDHGAPKGLPVARKRGGGAVPLRNRAEPRLVRTRLSDQPSWSVEITDPAPASQTIGDLIGEALTWRRVQIVGALFVAVLLPALIRWRLDLVGLAPSSDFSAFSSLSLGNAIVGTAVAALIGYVTMRQMRAHPGVRSIGYIFYSFAMSYGVLGLAFLFVRADYSRYEILCSFAFVVLWFVVVDHVTSHRTIWRLAYLPGVSPAALPRAARVIWQPATDPRQRMVGLTGVVADLRAEHSRDWERFLASCALEGLPVYDLRHIAESLTGKVKVQHLSENTLSSGLARIVYARIKRLIDIGGVVLAAPVFLPVILVFAALIKLESPGDAIFTQPRMGYRGRTFTIYKLRSMRPDAPGAGHAYTKDEDPRVTRVGAFIRKYRIDEFPQIWNIFRGEMSWIGPRPESMALSEWYDREVPFYCYRHMVRPGISGWAQVNQGNVAMIDAATEKLHYDFYYIKNLSPWLDLLIGAKTVQTILSGFGSK